MDSYRYLAIVVGGLPHHGKSTVASFISSESHMKHGNTSDIIYEHVAVHMGRDEEEVRSLPKEDMRKQLIATGDKLCESDPAFLVKELLRRHYQVITGVRKPDELIALRKFAPRLKFIWVDRPNYPIVKDNTLLSIAEADHVIRNDGTLDSLFSKVRQFCGDIMGGHGLKRIL